MTQIPTVLTLKGNPQLPILKEEGEGFVVGHTSQPICADTGNIYFLILAGFGDLLEKFKKSHGDKSFKIVQYSQNCTVRYCLHLPLSSGLVQFFKLLVNVYIS